MSEFIDRPVWGPPGRFEHAGVAAAPGARPPGWPHGFPAPGSEDRWITRAVAWLFDLCPPGYRRHRALKEHPVLLARLARHHVAAEVMAARHGYATVRVAIRDHGPNVVDEALRI